MKACKNSLVCCCALLSLILNAITGVFNESLQGFMGCSCPLSRIPHVLKKAFFNEGLQESIGC